VVDDEENIRLVLRTLLKRHGYQVETADSGDQALRMLDSFGPDVILTDVRMPKMGGMDLLATVKAKGNPATLIVMSAYGDVDQAIDALKAGAYDYIQKPFKPDEVVLALRKAEERELLRRENSVLRREVQRENKFEEILAKSESMRLIFRTIQKIAEYKTTVLITGESGVGKELVARALHRNSGRGDKRFVAVNCGAIPENLLESELFGHKRGAFTDAVADRRGLFEEADRGTQFLDQIGELPRGRQVKLLGGGPVGTIRRRGGTKDVTVDGRLGAATHRGLLAETPAGRVRGGLW
jgi:two-component system response regulator AtoC